VNNSHLFKESLVPRSWLPLWQEQNTPYDNLAYLLHMLKLSTPRELIRHWLRRCCSESTKWTTHPPSVSGCVPLDVRNGMTHTWWWYDVSCAVLFTHCIDNEKSALNAALFPLWLLTVVDILLESLAPGTNIPQPDQCRTNSYQINKGRLTKYFPRRNLLPQNPVAYKVRTSQDMSLTFFFCGVGLTSPGTAATSGLLYNPRW
jgi:hypothetical protein